MIGDVLKLPTLVIERDAEYGALIALRALKKETGIDLLGAPRSEDLLVLIQDSGGERAYKKITAIESNVSVRLIEDYMEKIGVDIPCVRNTRMQAKKKRGDQEEDAVIAI